MKQLIWLAMVGCVEQSEVAVLEIDEPDVDVSALYRGAIETRVEGAFELDVESCAYARTVIPLPAGNAFALTQQTTDGRCAIWIGTERMVGLFGVHQVCVVARSGTLPIGARGSGDDLELFSTHDRCNVHPYPLAYLAELVRETSTSFELSLESCAFQHVVEAEPYLGSWHVLVHPSYDDGHCDVWSWHFDDLGVSGERQCRFERDGSVTVELDDQLRMAIPGTACAD